jgi:hypothetical protein
MLTPDSLSDSLSDSLHDITIGIIRDKLINIYGVLIYLRRDLNGECILRLEDIHAGNGYYRAYMTIALDDDQIIIIPWHRGVSFEAVMLSLSDANSLDYLYDYVVKSRLPFKYQ